MNGRNADNPIRGENNWERAEQCGYVGQQAIGVVCDVKGKLQQQTVTQTMKDAEQSESNMAQHGSKEQTT